MIKILLLFSALSFLLIGCDKSNSSETIPSYVAVDEISVQIVDASQGTASHNITDSWLYVNNKLIGVFEAPFQVPVLESGQNIIYIEPGIKNGGSNSNRVIYSMMQEYILDTVLTKGEVLTVNPVHKYRPVTFAFMEDFDSQGSAFELAENSAPMDIISGVNAFENNSMYFAIDSENPTFECRSLSLLQLPKTGNDIYLEINFKCNSYFTFGFFSRENSNGALTEVRKRVYTFNPSTEWKKVYVNLKDHIMDSNGTEFRLFFISAFPENSDLDKIEVYIDNIKIIYR